MCEKTKDEVLDRLFVISLYSEGNGVNHGEKLVQRLI